MSKPDDLLGSIGKLRPTEKLAQLLTIYAVSKAAGVTAVNLYKRRRADLTYTLTVSDGDENFYKLQNWLATQVSDKKQRSVVVRSPRPYYTVPTEDDLVTFRKKSPPPEVVYDGSREQILNLNGHKIKVWIAKHEPKISFDRVSNSVMPVQKADIVFLAKTYAGKLEVIKLLSEVLRKDNEPPQLKVARKWGDFSTYRIKLRELDTVVLKKDQKEAIVEDLEWFLGAEKEYERLGIPWHRGYMFHGPAGTGKTSLAKALANHFNMDVHYISLTDLEADVSIIEIMANIAPRSILLFEDIDIVHGTKDRDDDHKGISLAGILNAIDGVATPHGLIMIFTSNNIQELDPALTRPGRIDMIEELSYLDDEQVSRLAQLVLQHEVDLPPIRREISPAAAMEALVKRSRRDDPLEKLIKLIEG